MIKKYFTHTLMLFLVAFSSHTLGAEVNGHNVVSVKYDKGEWVQKNEKTWTSWQYARESKKANIYTEIRRDESSVYLEKDGATATLNLQTKKYTYKKKGKSQVFDIVKASSKTSVEQVNAYNAAFIRYNNNGGRYVDQSVYQAPVFGITMYPTWEQWHDKKDKKPRKFQETGRDQWSIYLEDDDAKVRIDLWTKEVFYTQLKPKKSAKKVYSVINAYRAIPSEGIDELTIERIQTIGTAGGMDTAGKAGYDAVKLAVEKIASKGFSAAARGSVLAETLVRAQSNGGTGKDVVSIVINAGYNEFQDGLYRDSCSTKKAMTAGSNVKSDLEDLRYGTSGEILEAMFSTLDGYIQNKVSLVDDLLVSVDGKALWSKPKEMKKGEKIYPNKKFIFRRDYGAIIQLMEKDVGAGNDDDLGAIRVTTWTDMTFTKSGDCVEKMGNTYLVLAPEREDGSVYRVDVSIKEDVGNFDDLVEEQVCGTKTCVAVPNDGYYKDINLDRVDRDKDKSDLKKCPSGYYTFDYPKYDQIWPAADVYLRRCKIIPPY
jgi:hypothetical protein